MQLMQSESTPPRAGAWRDALRRESADTARWRPLVALAGELSLGGDATTALDAVMRSALLLTGARDGAILARRSGRWQVLVSQGRALPPGASVVPPQPAQTASWLMGAIPGHLRTFDTPLPAAVCEGVLAIAVDTPPSADDAACLHLLASIAGGYAAEPTRTQRKPRRVDPRLAGLTARERQVLALLPRGLTNNELGAELGIAGGTVKVHVERILHKLSLSDRTQAAVFAVANGMAA